MMIQNKVVVGKMNDEAPGNAIKEFVGLKTKIYSFLIDDSIERKQLKGFKKNAVATIIHGECKVVLLNKNCLKHFMNRIQSKNQITGTCNINKISLSSLMIKYTPKVMDMMN